LTDLLSSLVTSRFTPFPSRPSIISFTMRLLSLLLSLLLFTSFSFSAAEFDPTDCTLRSLTVEDDLGPLQLTPPFDRNTYEYTLTVPFETDGLFLTAEAYQQGDGMYVSYAYAAGDGDWNVRPSVASGSRSSKLPLEVGPNRLAATLTCNCIQSYFISVMRKPMSYTKGDPQFSGMLGQSFQVHGVPGEVYNIISDPLMQMNARFIFLDSGECPIFDGKPAQACWTHPGTYLGEVGVKTSSGQRIHLQAGSASEGFKSVQVDGRELEMEEMIELSGAGEGAFIVHNSTHLVEMQLSHFHLAIENSDQFVNYRLHVLNWAGMKSSATHGLLGQTHRHPERSGKQVKEIDGMVEDYRIDGGDLFGDQFTFNKFIATQ